MATAKSGMKEEIIVNTGLKTIKMKSNLLNVVYHCCLAFAVGFDSKVQSQVLRRDRRT